MMLEHWRPTASLQALRLRAALMRKVRDFFHARDVLEVDTPVLCAGAATDPQLQSLCLTLSGQQLYLQTSPEFAMKRLLASGSGAIFQLGKVFRADEVGRQHNPEFTLLEWYRPGLDEWQLMREMDELLTQCLPDRLPDRPTTSRTVSYTKLFADVLEVDVHGSSTEELADVARRHVNVGAMNCTRDEWLQLLFTHCLEPTLSGITFVTDFPASQAALARIRRDEHGHLVARRFEVYVDGMELANGYYELTDAAEQRSRFEADNRQREALGRVTLPLDERLLAALTHGLPACAGVALGFDRLVMLAAGASSLAEVMPFTTGDA